MKLPIPYLFISWSLICFCKIDTKAQSAFFTMSSVGMMGNSISNSESIQFNSSKNCLFIENGLALTRQIQANKAFVLGCPIDIQYNTLGIKFYPNPVHENAQLILLQKPPLSLLFTLSIWTPEGQMITNSKIAARELQIGVQLHLSSLQPGTYILKLQAASYVDAIKFIKLN